MAGRLTVFLLFVLPCTGPNGLFAGDAQPVSYSYAPPYPVPMYGSAPQYGDCGPVSGTYSPFYQHQPVGPDGIVTERLPADAGGFYGESPIDNYLREIAKNTWVRLEYLSWTYEDTDHTLLGSPVQGVRDPRRPFPVTFNTGGGTINGFAHVNDLSSIGLKDTQGIRATLGVPLATGTIEASIFAFQEAQDSFQEELDPLPVGATIQDFIATSTLLNGQISRNLFLYDQSLTADFTSDLWGAEANFIFDPVVPGAGFKIRPLFGFQFLGLEERLTQTGVFDQNGFLQTPQVSTIDSVAKNRVYAPQIGVRFELVNRWFTLGFEPKIAFGVNVVKDRVVADKIRSIGDPTVTTTATAEKFAPMGNFDVNAQIHVNENLSLFVSYDLIVAAGISRPQNNVLYDDAGSAAPLTAIRVHPGFDNMVIQGISVGGELRFR